MDMKTINLQFREYLKLELETEDNVAQYLSNNDVSLTTKVITSVEHLYSYDEVEIILEACIEKLKIKNSLMHLCFLHACMRRIIHVNPESRRILDCFVEINAKEILDRCLRSNCEVFLNATMEFILYIQFETEKCPVSLFKILKKYQLINKKFIIAYINTDINRNSLLMPANFVVNEKSAKKATGLSHPACLCKSFLKLVIDDIVNAKNPVSCDLMFLLHDKMLLDRAVNNEKIMTPTVIGILKSLRSNVMKRISLKLPMKYANIQNVDCDFRPNSVELAPISMPINLTHKPNDVRSGENEPADSITLPTSVNDGKPEDIGNIAESKIPIENAEDENSNTLNEINDLLSFVGDNNSAAVDDESNDKAKIDPNLTDFNESTVVDIKEPIESNDTAKTDPNLTDINESTVVDIKEPIESNDTAKIDPNLTDINESTVMDIKEPVSVDSVCCEDNISYINEFVPNTNSENGEIANYINESITNDVNEITTVDTNNPVLIENNVNEEMVPFINESSAIDINEPISIVNTECKEIIPGLNFIDESITNVINEQVSDVNTESEEIIPNLNDINESTTIDINEPISIVNGESKENPLIDHEKAETNLISIVNEDRSRSSHKVSFNESNNIILVAKTEYPYSSDEEDPELLDCDSDSSSEEMKKNIREVSHADRSYSDDYESMSSFTLIMKLKQLNFENKILKARILSLETELRYKPNKSTNTND